MGIIVKQRDMRDCGTACLASISSHYGSKRSVDHIRHLTNYYECNRVRGIVSAADQIGLIAKGVWGKLCYLSHVPLPCMAHVVIGYHLFHFVVIYKVTGNNLIMMDPREGLIKKITLNEFEQIWSTILVLFAPGEKLMGFGLKFSVIWRFLSLKKTVAGKQEVLKKSSELFEPVVLNREQKGKLHVLEKDMVGDVHIEGVSFSYGTRTEVFDGLNLTIEKGKITAIVGESGSGKSTITYLLQKLYPLKKGKIRIGNYNIQQITNESLRRIIGSVSQQLNIFSGTVAENIATGDEEPDMRRMVGICSKLGILGFIEQLPDGFGTRLGENGASLSGGQKQLIAIARSLYRSPRILILDEAMSNLDTESEAIVQKVLHDLRDRGLTVLMITHRLSSLAGADRIVVLDKGKVVEQGTHQDLYNRAGKYYRLWQKQIPAFLN